MEHNLSWTKALVAGALAVLLYREHETAIRAAVGRLLYPASPAQAPAAAGLSVVRGAGLPGSPPAPMAGAPATGGRGYLSSWGG